MQESFIFYKSYLETIEKLPPDEQLKAFLAIARHSIYEQEQQVDGLADLVYTMAKPQIEANHKKRNDGSKGGRPANKPVVIESDNHSYDNEKPNANVNINENVNENANAEAGTKEPDSPDGDSAAEAKLGTQDFEKLNNTPYKKIMELYNSICIKLPKIKIIDGERKKAVNARYRTYGDLAVFRTLFEKAAASKFMTGEGKNNWVGSFDFLMTADGMAKTLEGKYENKPEQSINVDNPNPHGYTW